MTTSLSNILDYLANRKWLLLVILFIISLAVAIQNFCGGVYNFWDGEYTFYNNYIIFKNSFAHLIESQNLYQRYPGEYADFYKYSPTFALCMVPFHFLPDAIGLLIWYLLNVFVLYYSVASIKHISDKNKFIILLFLLPELILSIQNSQSNALITGLVIAAFNQLERGKYQYATLLITLGVFIKIYAVFGFILFLFYPHKLKGLAWAVFYATLLFFLPLLLIGFSELLWQYENWYALLKRDESLSTGMSIYAYTRHILPKDYFKLTTFLAGLLALFLPLIKLGRFKDYHFRLHYLSLLLVWLVVLNYKAESPAYVIAMTGIAIWYFTSRPTTIKKVLLYLTFLFTALWSSDLVPKLVKDSFFELTYVKSFFPIILTFVICFELLKGQNIVSMSSKPK